MAGKCVMLEKKLHELESELADLFRLPPHSSPAAEQISFDDVKERIEFLEKLLAAEAESQQSQDPGGLHGVDERLVRLKAAVSDWIRSRNRGFDAVDDTQSVCSDCTQSHGLQRRASVTPTRDVEETKAETETETEEEEEAAAVMVEGGRKWGEIGKWCGVFGSGMIAGVMCMVFTLHYYDYLIQEEAFSIPPT